MKKWEVFVKLICWEGRTHSFAAIGITEVKLSCEDCHSSFRPRLEELCSVAASSDEFT